MTIKQVAEKFNITPDTLRYYEKAGLINNVPRVNGIRKYGQHELDTIEFIVCMRSAGLSIEVLAKYIELIKKGDSTAEERRNILINERAELKKKLDEMQAAYEKLNYKIDIYYAKMLEHEKKL